MINCFIWEDAHKGRKFMLQFCLKTSKCSNIPVAGKQVFPARVLKGDYGGGCCHMLITSLDKSGQIHNPIYQSIPSCSNLPWFLSFLNLTK